VFLTAPLMTAARGPARTCGERTRIVDLGPAVAARSARGIGVLTGRVGAVPRWSLVTATVFAVAALVGCGSSSTPRSAQATSRSKPAGRNPSIASQMICNRETQANFRQSLGVPPTQVTSPTWVDHVYTCRYVYPSGVLTLSVKELSSAAETTSYYDQLGRALGRRPDRIALGQGAFLTTNGSLVVRKNYKVMDVDVSQLPTQFGSPPLVPSDVALSAAAIIMTCWKDA
jgi:hypothetical protein